LRYRGWAPAALRKPFGTGFARPTLTPSISRDIANTQTLLAPEEPVIGGYPTTVNKKLKPPLKTILQDLLLNHINTVSLLEDFYQNFSFSFGFIQKKCYYDPG